MKKWIAGTILALTGASGTYYGAVVTPDTYDEGQVLGAVDVVDVPTDKDRNPQPERSRTVKKFAYIGGRLSDKPNEIVSLRTKHSRTFAQSTNTFTTEVIPGVPQYFEDENGTWWQADYATTTKTKFLLKPKSKHYRQANPVVAHLFTAYADTSTFYPDPDAETTTVDGTFDKRECTPFSDCRDATSSTNAEDNASENYPAKIHTYANKYYVGRGIFLFDTSALGSSATLSSATFSLYITTTQAEHGTGGVALVASTPASNTSLTTDDYDQLGSTRFATDLNTSTISTGAYNTWTLNSSGLAAINKIGVTKLGVRMADDLDNTPPSVTPGLKLEGIVSFMAEQSGTSQDPKLTVTYTVPVATSPQVIFFE